MQKLKKPIYFYLVLFIIATMIGSLLLYLPYTGKKPISLIDAIFVASSAFTVTGLSPIDIGTQFNIFGEIIILILIQIGGLGIVTITLFTLILLNKKITLKNRHLLMVSWNIDQPGGIVKLILHVVMYSMITEFIGAVLLALSFVPKFGLANGIFTSVFTSVSAFNNAGFALFKNNLVDYTQDPIVMIVIPALIILGGLGHLVLIDLITCKKLKKLALHSKVVLSTTVSLIILGTICFFLLEQHHTLSHMNRIEQVGAAFFQSVTTRTAGFNSVDIGALQTSTAGLMMALMFIGGAPLSAAGGIKVTTLAIIVVFLVSSLRNTPYPTLFHKSVSDKLIRLALSTALLSGIYVIVMTFILSILNPHAPFLSLMFEVVSAFGTVGLSMDFTTEYQGATKAIIITIMLAGKLGLLTIAHAFISTKTTNYHYAKGHIHL